MKGELNVLAVYNKNVKVQIKHHNVLPPTRYSFSLYHYEFQYE